MHSLRGVEAGGGGGGGGGSVRGERMSVGVQVREVGVYEWRDWGRCNGACF